MKEFDKDRVREWIDVLDRLVPSTCDHDVLEATTIHMEEMLEYIEELENAIEELKEEITILEVDTTGNDHEDSSG